MKKIVYIINAIAILFTTPVLGQDDTGDTQEDEAVVVPPPKQMKQSDFQNWMFAGGSLIAAVGAILLVAWSPGSAPPPGEATFPN